MAKLLTTAYFPPISYFAAIAQDMEGLVRAKGEDRKSFPSSPLSPSVIYIEACENYQKQSYRNRCHFYAADGKQSLSFPITHSEGTHKHLISEVRIDYSKPWVMQHKRAIISAYRTSAYFEYYQDELFAIRMTESYDAAPECEDLREVIHPKRPDRILENLELKKPYFQVFAEKHGFIPDLSIMDLLFNEGPDSIVYLKKL